MGSAVIADGLVDDAGIVNLDLAPDSVADSIRSANIPGLSENGVLAAAQVVHRARYSNLYSLLRDHLNEEQYIEVVRNQILVDIQGEDCLSDFHSTCTQCSTRRGGPFPGVH